MHDERTLSQLNIIVDDMGKACDFYRLLGLRLDAQPDAEHVEITLPNGLSIELDTARSVCLWDGGWNDSTGGRVVLGFTVATRKGVDALYRRIVEAGFRSRQRPYDAFWGARYAVVEDPSGNGVGLMGPIDASRKYWPPKPPSESTRQA